MTLINMTDKDRIYHYAKNNTPSNFYILDAKQNTNSYYLDCDDTNSKCARDIMEYDVEHFGHIKQYLDDLLNNGRVGFDAPDLLAKIVAATTIKNMPKETLQNTSAQKEAYESISQNNAPPVFIYEF